MGPTWVLPAPDGPHVGPMNLAIRELSVFWAQLQEGENTRNPKHWCKLKYYFSARSLHVNLTHSLFITRLDAGGYCNNHISTWVLDFRIRTHYTQSDIKSIWSCTETNYSVDIILFALKHTGAVILFVDFLIINTLRPRQNGRHFADDIFNIFSWMKMYEFRSNLHWNLFLWVQLTMFQHWIR